MTDAKEIYELANSIKEGTLAVVRYDFKHDEREFEVELRNYISYNCEEMNAFSVFVIVDEDGKRVPHCIDAGWRDESGCFDEQECRLILARTLKKEKLLECFVK